MADQTAAASPPAPQEQPQQAQQEDVLMVDAQQAHVEQQGQPAQEQQAGTGPAEQVPAPGTDEAGAAAGTTPEAATTAATPPVAKSKSGAYTQREEYLQQQEAEGNIAFVYVENDGQPHNMIYLIGLKNIFSKQLPNMPKEYICRLVLDRRHRSVALVKKNGTVIGGITYRIFPDLKFGEIAFCAITASEQVKGYGTRLMNYTKEYAVHRDHLTHFLTYADNNAVGYFSKQGFTKEITLAKDRWYGWIKDYDGGTLMECVMHPNIHYAQLPQMVSAQRTALEARIQTVSNAHVVRQGLTGFKVGSKRQQIPIASIPGVTEAGWSPEKYPSTARYWLLLRQGASEVNPDNLQKFMTNLWQEIERDEDAWPFRQPVSKSDVPDYYDIIKDPMDLSLIHQRLKQAGSYYVTLDIFVADFRRMFNNCRIYNAADTVYYKIANKLEEALDRYLDSHLAWMET